MKVAIEKDYDIMSKKAATLIAQEIRRKPDIVLGFATGSTPLGTYAELIRMHKEEGLDFSRVVTFNLDEYYGLLPDNPQSYNYFMYENLFKHINVKPENIHIPDGMASDVKEYCRNYEEKIKEAGGIDLQLLGIGVNGHIGFNEPDDKLIVETHLTDLTQDTVKANSRFFDNIEEVPKKAITMGVGTILKARKILLLANGESKAQTIYDLLSRDSITTQNPSSLLLLHDDVTVIVDEKAAKLYR